jgi:hypothetical protein
VRLWTGFSQIPTIQVLFSRKNPKSNSRSGSKYYNLLTTRAQGSVCFSGEHSLIFDKKIGSFFFSSVDLTSFAIIWLNFSKLKYQKNVKTRGLSHFGLAIYIKRYLKAKEEL